MLIIIIIIIIITFITMARLRQSLLLAHFQNTDTKHNGLHTMQHVSKAFIFVQTSANE